MKEVKDIRVVFGILCALFGFVAWRRYPSGVGMVSAGTTAILFTVLLIAPLKLRPLMRQWLKLARALSYVSTRVILGAVFVLVIIPIAIIMRLRGRDPLDRNGSAATYWKQYKIEGLEDAHSYEKPF